MSLFRPKTIERKLRLMIVATASGALVVVAIVFVLFEFSSYRAELRDSLSRHAALLSYQSELALDLDLSDKAQEVIESLKTSPDIAAAGIYRTNGSVFARYSRPGTTNSIPVSTPPLDGLQPLEYVAGITNVEMKQVGTIYLRADLTRERQFLRKCSLVLLTSIGGAFIVAWLLATWFERIVTVPIRQLLETARTVSQHKDYSVRASTRSNDEIGELVTGFNDMLDQIQTRDQELKRNQEHLEEQVVKRTRELKQANEALIAAKAHADAASEAKSQFLANMSHELRTPLNAIIGYSEMLQEEADDLGVAEFKPDLQKIHGAGKHLLGLINDILDLSKIEAGKMTLFVEEFDAAKLVREIAATVQPLIAKQGNTLELDCPATLGTIRTDQTKVRQVLFNLLSNASKFTERGCIRLSVRKARRSVISDLSSPLDEGQTTAPQHVDDCSLITFSVTDTGIGMTAEQLARLFRPFAQADASTTKKFGGTGLGLALSRRCCELMGGSLTVTSEPGCGSTFTVTLPADLPDHTSTAFFAKVPATPQDGPGAVVLVVDDDPAVRDLLARSLSKEGLRVETAANGAQGLELARRLRPQVITLDVMMPGLDGWGVLAALKADPLTADIPVVMMTIVDERNLGFSLGAADYLTKPVDFARLRDVVARHVPAGMPHFVLVVEDDPVIRDLLVAQLTTDGWEPETATNGHEGLERVAARTPGLILLDLMMPEMDGFEFLTELRRRPGCEHIPVIVITAKTLTDEDHRRLNGEVSRILEKGTTSKDQLLAEVRALLAPV
jgi:signal transduction histidine kinase/DNA-binding response OmpR family regulator